MIVHYQAFAQVSGNRWHGDVVKENHHTVWMIFHPPEELKREAIKQGTTLIPIGPIKRHKRKHRVSRFM
jgi:hypothetical protein